MGEFSAVRWRWTADGEAIVGDLRVDGRVTLAELIDHLEQVAPGLDPQGIEIHWSSVKWTRPATVEEQEARDAWKRDRDVARERWERETLARLIRKYGSSCGDTPREVADYEPPAGG